MEALNVGGTQAERITKGIAYLLSDCARGLIREHLDGIYPDYAEIAPRPILVTILDKTNHEASNVQQRACDEGASGLGARLNHATLPQPASLRWSCPDGTGRPRWNRSTTLNSRRLVMSETPERTPMGLLMQVSDVAILASHLRQLLIRIRVKSKSQA